MIFFKGMIFSSKYTTSAVRLRADGSRQTVLKAETRGLYFEYSLGYVAALK